VVGASKADNDPDTGDPTTLESWISRGAAASVDGSYRFALTDSFDFAAGGELVVVDGRVTEINTTYFNWDKIDATGAPECREVFLAQIELATPIDINEFEDGVVVEQSFESGGVLEFELSFSTTDNLEIEGSVSAVGSGFTLMRAGCNGEFPALALAGGKGE
jgi:hypothetical protein